jgi:5-methylcytosine-specific restriction enzyme subunit McrC
MTDAIRLSEHQDVRVHLEPGDAEFILARLGQHISIRREVRSDAYVLNPGSYVGVVALPSGRRLESAPKVPVSNLFYMLAVAWGLESPFRDEAVNVDRLDELLEFVVAHFADLIERRISRGLYRTYVEQEANLATVRGRIAVADDVRRNFVLRHRTFCRYTDFTWDIPENQVVRQVVHLVSGWVRQPALRLRLRRLDAQLAEVTPTALPASAIDRFTYHRLNDDYRPIHRLCRLFLEGASLAEDTGPFTFRAFLIDMNRLFEAFVTQVLRERAPLGSSVRAQVPLHLGHDKRVPMRPDLVIDISGQLALVGDCKYKRLAPDEFRNHDVYQLLAYCTATGVRRGLLVYPVHEMAMQDEVRIRNTLVQIEQTTIQLGGSLNQLWEACDAFARGVFARADQVIDEYHPSLLSPL